MEEKDKMESTVFIQLYNFYKRNKEWLVKYAPLATKFDAEMVERKVSFNDLNGMLEDYTVLILTANSVEQNILTRKLYQEVNSDGTHKKRLPEIYVDGCVYQFASVQNINIVHMHPNSTSSFPIGGSANAVRSALERFRPKLVVSLGVAFGIDPEKQQLGDVLLSSGIIPYDVFNKDTEGEITLRPRDILPTHEALCAWNVLMRNSAFSLEEQKKEHLSLIERELDFQWQFGTMLSGGSVLSNENKKQALLRAAKKASESKVIGGEMEGVGIYFECRKPDIPCIVIKGICDWGAEKNGWDKVIQIVSENEQKNDASQTGNASADNDLVKDCVQAYAMENATEALFRLLRFDSNFLNTYSALPKSAIPSAYKRKQKLAQVKQFLASKKNRIFQIVSEYLIWIIVFAVFNFYLGKQGYLNVEKISWFVYQIEALILMGKTAVLVFQKSITPYPIKVRHAWVDLSFQKLSLQPSYVQLNFNNSRPIYQVVISWWMPSGKIKLDSLELGDLKSSRVIELKIWRMICPKAILQVDYELANGDHYVHLISRKRAWNTLFTDKNKIVAYCERIFLMNDSKGSLVGIQNAIVKQV